MILDQSTQVVKRNTTSLYVKGTKISQITMDRGGYRQPVDAEMAARELAIEAYSDKFGLIDWSRCTITSAFTTGTVTVEVAVSP